MAEPITYAWISDLVAAFPREQLATLTLDVYVRELADVPPTELGLAVRQLIRTAAYFPTVAAIRGVVAERALELPGEADALAQIERQITEAREGHGAQPLHPLVAEAAVHVGGARAFRVADEPSVVRGQFLRLYRELRSRRLQEATVGVLAPGVAPVALLHPGGGPRALAVP